MKILMVYEAIPEHSYVYVLDSVSADDWKWMQLTHGKYVGTDMDKRASEACEKLSVYLQGKARTSASEVGPLLLRSEGFDYFVHTGFLL